MTESSVPIFAINLDSSSERWASLEEAAADAGVEVYRVPGIDGRLVLRSEWTGFDRLEFERHTGRSVLPGEYGCYRSHLLALQTFLDRNVPYGLVIEDDVFPDDRTAGRVSAIIDALGEFDVVRLVNHRSRLFIRLATTSKGDEIGRTVFGPQGSAAAYLVSREGARKILAALSTMILPWDVALERFWSSETEIFSCRKDVFVFSAHRADSTIIPAAGYADTKFEFAKRAGARAFQLRDAFVRAHHVLLAPNLALGAAVLEKSAMAEAQSGRKPVTYLLGALGVLIFLSAVWIETDAYRVAGLIMVLAALTYYFKRDLYTYTKPLIGWAGLACALWTFYVFGRMGVDYLSRPGRGFGAAEGIYLLPLLYPTFGYALLLFVRRPFAVVCAFMAVSLAVLLYDTDYHRILIGSHALTSLHNNTIHAANASGFILICAVAFADYLFSRAEMSFRVRAALLALAALTSVLSIVNIMGLLSKGVWAACAVALAALFVAMAWGKAGSRARALIIAALAATILVGAVFKDRLVARGADTAETTISLMQSVLSGGGVASAVGDAIADPYTPFSVKSRLMTWSNAAEIWARHPVFGSGIAWLDDWDNRRYKEGYSDLLHNGYLEIAVRYGIAGLLFYAALFAWSLWTVRKAAHAELIDPAAYHAHLAAMLFFFISLFTNSNIRLAFGETYMWFAVSFGFYCQYLLQRKGLANLRTYA